MASSQPYGTLRILLFVISVIEALAGLCLLFASSWVLSLASGSVEFPNAGFVLILVKAIGIAAIASGYLLCAAARNPARYIAVIDTFAFVLLAGSALSIYASVTLHIDPFYPGPYLIVRAVLQLILAVVIIALRPRGAPIQPSA